MRPSTDVLEDGLPDLTFDLFFLILVLFLHGFYSDFRTLFMGTYQGSSKNFYFEKVLKTLRLSAKIKVLSFQKNPKILQTLVQNRLKTGQSVKHMFEKLQEPILIDF